MIIHKCDICRIALGKEGKKITAGCSAVGYWDSHEFCAKCGEPVLDFLRKNKFLKEDMMGVSTKKLLAREAKR